MNTLYIKPSPKTTAPAPLILLDRGKCTENTCFMDKATAVYVRVSTQDQRHDSQLRELEAYCRQRGWKDLAYYQEKESGAKASRPQLDRMMTDLRIGKIKRVVAFKLDR